MTYIEMDIISRCLMRQTRLHILLPDDMNAKKKPVPVVYLLHGARNDGSEWMLKSEVAMYTERYRVVAVAPSCELSFYCNQDYGRFLDLVALEIPELMQEYFGIAEDPSRTYLSGLSMGGYGTYKIGLTYPEKYRALFPIAGGNLAGKAGIMPSCEPDGTPRPHSIAFHTTDMVSLRDTEYDLFYLAKQAIESGKSLPKIYYTCGTEDGALANCRDMAEFMRGLEGDPFCFEYREIPGVHDFESWRPAIKDFFAMIGRTEAER